VRRPAAIFVAALALGLILFGNRFVLTNDEGILLEPASRMARGQVPYTDFFGYMTPGSYWLQAAVYRLFGVQYFAGRILTLLDFAIHCAVLFALVQKNASLKAAFAATGLFVAFQTADPTFLTAQHRWDSSALILLAFALSVFETKLPAFVPGALAAFAAWCTPSIALPGLVILAWTTLCARHRLPGFCLGGLAVCAAATAQLILAGNWTAFLEQLSWLSRNYAASNVMPYGSIIGGYQALLTGPVQTLLVIGIALPAILPVTATIGWLIHRQHTFLFAFMAAMVATAFPRADVFHLAYAAVPAYALSAIWIWRSRLAPFAVVPAVALAALFLLNTLLTVTSLRPLATAAGPVRVPQDLHGPLEAILKEVRPGQKLFVHPYLPVLYILTGARNPTRYCYVQPGMMTASDEAQVLAQLDADPPGFVAWLALSDAEFRRVFPSARGAAVRFAKLEEWIEQRTVPTPHSLAGYQIRKVVSEPGH
jgi:hypothetical protein